ncbi:VacJ family lipoprotein [Methylomonas sp. SURF-2]|uniref:VacJ family lipoprotein n=1 Tax=Methylomonas subterranea TaxID=2952225 RepID=A0ABT1TGZ7_9GAMM|nr:VacJ family lipoprotein [Methylomonas sp. SURF-2]MCQ8104727.1 VacJ family lipoprotein [Methylomonas sp. SURF-2]
MFLVAGALTMAGCASTGNHAETSAEQAAAMTGRADPFEGFNRSMYAFNSGLDKYFLKPVSDGYKWVTPDFMETGVSNFFSNLKGINVVLNDLLQGKFQQGAADAGRFLTNTTIGVGGLIDVASQFGLENNIEDFGQTLAVWGVDEGAYLVLPIIGPTTLRDGGGLILDKAANPGTYVPGTSVLEGISDRANAEGALNFINEAALDPYVFTRESFMQYRRHLVNDGKTDQGHYEWEADVAMDEVDDNTAAAKAEGSEDISVSGSEEQTVADAKAWRSEAFDDMLKSYQQASMKMDRLSQGKLSIRN